MKKMMSVIVLGLCVATCHGASRRELPLLTKKNRPTWGDLCSAARIHVRSPFPDAFRAIQQLAKTDKKLVTDAQYIHAITSFLMRVGDEPRAFNALRSYRDQRTEMLMKRSLTALRDWSYSESVRIRAADELRTFYEIQPEYKEKDDTPPFFHASRFADRRISVRRLGLLDTVESRVIGFEIVK